jgi:tight adherence protein C
VNTLFVGALAAGALLGTGLAIILSGLLRWHPELADALAMLDERLLHPPPATSNTLGPCEVVRRACLAIARRLPGGLGDRDLQVLQLDRDRYLLQGLVQVVGYAACGPALAALLLVLDAGLPALVPGAFTVAGAVIGWTSHARRVRNRAEDVREELRYALVAYLQQVSLLRRGGAGVATALRLPAELLADSSAMRRLRHELDLAERAGLMPWEGLRRFGAQIDVPEFEDLSTIAETAGQDGGAIIETLLARSENLNDELLADAHTAAHRASGQMSVPGALQVFLIAAWVLYPAAAALLSA